MFNPGMLEFYAPSFSQKIRLEGNIGVGPAVAPVPIFSELSALETEIVEGRLPRLFFTSSSTDTIPPEGHGMMNTIKLNNFL